MRESLTLSECVIRLMAPNGGATILTELRDIIRDYVGPSHWRSADLDDTDFALTYEYINPDDHTLGNYVMRRPVNI